MEQKKSVVFIIKRKIAYFLSLSLLVVSPAFSQTVEIKDKSFFATESESIPMITHETFTPWIAIKSNLFYWVGLMPDFKHYSWIPNLSVEGYFANRWSVDLTGMYASKKVGKDKFFGVSSGSLEPRFWFDNSGAYQWLYAGVYGEIGEFDNQRIHIDDNRTGKFAGVGISVGVYIPINDRIGAEIGLRGGYSRRTVDYYSVENSHDYFDFSKKENKWGITSVNISIVCRLGR